MLIISGSYVCSNVVGRYALAGASPINPAIAMGILASEVLAGDYKFAWGWVLLVFPILGGILGLILFECVYKKTAGAVKEVDDDNSDKGDGKTPIQATLTMEIIHMLLIRSHSSSEKTLLTLKLL